MGTWLMPFSTRWRSTLATTRLSDQDSQILELLKLCEKDGLDVDKMAWLSSQREARETLGELRLMSANRTLATDGSWNFLCARRGGRPARWRRCCVCAAVVRPAHSTTCHECGRTAHIWCAYSCSSCGAVVCTRCEHNCGDMMQKRTEKIDESVKLSSKSTRASRSTRQ